MHVEVKILGVSISIPLARHDMADQPTTPANHVGYVQFADSNRLFMAFWRRGEWLDHQRRPFERSPIAWYSLEPGRG